MMFEVEITKPAKVAVKYLKAECGVRYWEDATVNGVEDTEGDLIPCRVGDTWCPVIDLETGAVQDWPAGTAASIHYKVCDDGRYTLLGADLRPVASIVGYVPKIMCPGGGGFGDYVIMSVSDSGAIADWRADLTPWQTRP